MPKISSKTSSTWFLLTEKKDKKEKNAKTGDENQEPDKSHEDPQSPKKNKRFGMFRLSGKKSKSEKKNGKHGSSDSLKRDGESSADSVQFEKRTSVGSLDESTSGTEPASGSAESHEESDTRLSDLGESFEAANSLNDGKELNDEAEKNDVTVPQRGLLKGEGVQEQPGTRQDTPDPNVETTVLREDLIYRVETSKEVESTEECVNTQELSPIPVVLSQTFHFEEQSSVLSNKSKQDSDDKNQNPTDTSHMKNEESVNPMKPEVSKETDEGVVLGSVRGDVMHFEDVIKEHDRDVTSSEDGSVDTVVSTGFCNTEVVTMDETKPKDYTINRETKEKEESENDYAYDKSGDVEELIISTYSDRKTIEVKEEGGEELPRNEETVVLEYVAKQKDVSIEETHEEARVDEEPIVPLKGMKVNSFQGEMFQVQGEPGVSQITEKKENKTQETHFEEEPIALTETNAHTFTKERTVQEGFCNTDDIVVDTLDETKSKDHTINRETKDKEESENEFAYEKSGDVEELIISTNSDRKTIEVKEEDGEELPRNEETVVLEYVAKQKDVSIEETHEEARVDEEPIVPLKGMKVNSFQDEMLQVQVEPDVLQSTEKKENKTQETYFEEKPIALTEKTAYTFTEERTVVEGDSPVFEDKTQENGPALEQELVTPIRVERNECKMQEKAQEETLVNEGEGEVLTNPEKTEQLNWSHLQEEPQTREEPVVLICSEKQETSIEVQFQEDQPIDVREKDTARDKDEETDKKTQETSKHERKEAEEPIGFRVNKKSSFLDQQNQPLSSTPKLNTSYEAAVKPDHSYTSRSYIQHSKHVQFVTSVREVKLSIKLLLAQLAAENKKLRELQMALNEVLKSGLVERA